MKHGFIEGAKYELNKSDILCVEDRRVKVYTIITTVNTGKDSRGSMYQYKVFR